jgi:hypothetical protein
MDPKVIIHATRVRVTSQIAEMDSYRDPTNFNSK